MVNKVAADLGLMASEVRSLLLEKYFEIAATSAACLLLDDNINNNNINSTTLRPNRTAKQIVRQKGDKNILGRSRTSLLYIVVLNLRHISSLCRRLEFFEWNVTDKACESGCTIITFAWLYFSKKKFLRAKIVPKIAPSVEYYKRNLFLF